MSIISSIYKKNISGNTKKDVVIVVVFVLFILWSIINTSSTEEKQNDSVEITNNTEQSTESGKSIIGDLALVIEVIDGDTIKIEGGETIRYLGMDTPEPSHKPPDCYAKEASEKNREMVEGQTVRIIKDVRDRDRYGRLLRYVYVDDTFVNLELVKQGYARAFTVPPDIAYEEDLLIAEQEARESKNGLWGGCDESLLNIWEQNTSERAETAEFQATADEDILEDAPECFCDYNFYDCRDFASQEDAQSLYDCCWEKIQQDLHLIDGDEDGYACEQLLDK